MQKEGRERGEGELKERRVVGEGEKDEAQRKTVGKGPWQTERS